MIWENIEWKDESLLNEYKKNVGLILDYKLAIENYEDFKNVKLAKFGEIEKLWYDGKKNKSTEIELFNLSQKVLKEYANLVNELGKQNFIFYKNGGIEFRG